MCFCGRTERTVNHATLWTDLHGHNRCVYRGLMRRSLVPRAHCSQLLDNMLHKIRR